MASPSPPADTDPDAFDVDPALAASMGFTSFGAAPRPAKRQKMTGRAGHNAHAARSTGANTVQMGVRRTPGRPKETEERNPEEIELDTDEDEQDANGETQEAQASSITASNAESDMASAQASESAPKSKPKGKGKAPASSPSSSGLAAFLARGQMIRPPPPPPVPLPDSLAAASSEVSTGATAGSVELPLHSTYNAPPAPPPPPYVLPTRSEDLTSADLAILRRGVRDERGDLAIYMPSFVEDPWKGQGDGKTFKSVGKA